MDVRRWNYGLLFFVLLVNINMIYHLCDELNVLWLDTQLFKDFRRKTDW